MNNTNNSKKAIQEFLDPIFSKYDKMAAFVFIGVPGTGDQFDCFLKYKHISKEELLTSVIVGMGISVEQALILLGKMVIKANDEQKETGIVSPFLS